MSGRPNAHRGAAARAVGAVLLLAAGCAQAGSFITFSGDSAQTISHPKGYAGSGGQLVINVCLETPPPSGDPTQAILNALATYNNDQPTLGNVEDNPAGKPDFESVLLHELGHCIGMDHNALGPSEVQTGNIADARLFYTISGAGSGGTFDVDDGADNVRGTRDDVRGNDVNRFWFRKNVNDPWALPSGTIDRSTFSIDTSFLPPGFGFPENATSFAPCNGNQPSSSAFYGLAPTQNTMFPVSCTSKVVRKLAPDDSSTLAIARAGFDGTDGSGDDYTVQLSYAGETGDCDVRIQFVNDAGFAFCQISATKPRPHDRVITSAVAKFQSTVDWHFNQQDTTGGEPMANLWVFNTVDMAAPWPATEVAFTVMVSNAGPATADNVVLSLPTPGGMSFVGNSGDCATPFPCSLGALPAGDDRTVVATFLVDADVPAGIVIEATVAADSDTVDSEPGNNAASASVTVAEASADVSLQLDDGGTTAEPGAPLVYTLAIANAGPIDSEALVANMAVPAGLAFVHATGSGWTCGEAAGTVSCTRALLTAGSNADIVVELDVPIDYAGANPIVATASVDSDTLDHDTVNNSDTASTPVDFVAPFRIFGSGFEPAAP